MALTQDLLFKGIAIPATYITAVMSVIRLDKQSMPFGVNYKATAGEEVFHTHQVNAAYELDGVNPLQQTYSHLKGQAAFYGGGRWFESDRERPHLSLKYKTPDAMHRALG